MLDYQVTTWDILRVLHEFFAQNFLVSVINQNQYKVDSIKSISYF